MGSSGKKKWLIRPGMLIRPGITSKICAETKATSSLPEETKLVLVSLHPWKIKYIENPSEQVQIQAVKSDGKSIYCIDKPSLAVQVAAVRERGTALQMMDDPPDEVIFEALKNTGWALEFIDNPTVEMLRMALTTSPHIVFNSYTYESLPAELFEAVRPGLVQAIQAIQLLTDDKFERGRMLTSFLSQDAPALDLPTL